MSKNCDININRLNIFSNRHIITSQKDPRYPPLLGRHVFPG